jgi:hypothetical protein
LVINLGVKTQGIGACYWFIAKSILLPGGRRQDLETIGAVEMDMLQAQCEKPADAIEGEGRNLS